MEQINNIRSKVSDYLQNFAEDPRKNNPITQSAEWIQSRDNFIRDAWGPQAILGAAIPAISKIARRFEKPISPEQLNRMEKVAKEPLSNAAKNKYFVNPRATFISPDEFQAFRTPLTPTVKKNLENLNLEGNIYDPDHVLRTQKLKDWSLKSTRPLRNVGGAGLVPKVNPVTLSELPFITDDIAKLELSKDSGHFKTPLTNRPGGWFGEIEASPIGRKGGRWQYPSTTAAHEFGHMRDYNTASGRRIFRKTPRAANPAGLIGLGIGLANAHDRSWLGAGLEGALTQFLDPNVFRNIQSEIRADIQGRRIAKAAKTPWSTPNQILLRSSYGTNPFLSGFSGGVVSELLHRGSDQLAKGLAGGVIEPAARAIRGGDSVLESQLRKWGYDPDLYTFVEGDNFNSPRIIKREGINKKAWDAAKFLKNKLNRE